MRVNESGTVPHAFGADRSQTRQARGLQESNCGRRLPRDARDLQRSDEDRFVVINEHDADDFIFSTSYLGIERSENLIIVQITANNTRTVEQKKALFARIAQLLSQDQGLRPQDVSTNIVEVAKENWSFGNGVAQYA